MTTFSYYTCDVFTRERFGGNPLAVVPDARGLDDATMQALAAEFNYSETTFVLPANKGNTRQVRIFTPKAEMPFAGHPNIGTAYMLAALGEIPLQDGAAEITFEEKAGPVPVRIESDNTGAVFCELTAPRALSLGPEVPAARLADAAGLAESDIVTRVHSPRVASVGLSFLVAEVSTAAALARATPSVAVMRELAAEGIAHDVHLYTRDAGEFDLQARMFGPLDGVWEDPATGSANSALVALLAELDAGAGGSGSWRIAQGVEMGRPSELFGRVTRRADATATAHVGGYCVRVFDGSFSI